MTATRMPSRYLTKMGTVAEWLRGEIIGGRLKPGAPLLQDEIAELLDMSSTPVREAFGVLEAEGFLARRPHRGVVVAERDQLDVADAYEIRMVLEAFAVRRLTMREPDVLLPVLNEMDVALARAKSAMAESDINSFRSASSEFHMALIRGSGSRTLVELLSRIIPRSRVYGLDKTWMRRNHGEHLRIIEAIRGRDAARAVEIFAHHNEDNVARLRAEAGGTERP